MIWTPVVEEFPRDGYIHPLYSGKGTDGRHYRPVWHSVRGDVDYAEPGRPA